MESALTIHRQAEPVLFRGLYFASCGPDPSSRAFAAGLLQAPRGRLLADHALAVHSREAAALDRSYRRAAGIVALVTVAACLPVWLIGIRAELTEARLGWLTWAGLGLLAALWAAGLGLTALRAPQGQRRRGGPGRRPRRGGCAPALTGRFAYFSTTRSWTSPMSSTSAAPGFCADPVRRGDRPLTSMNVPLVLPRSSR